MSVSKCRDAGVKGDGWAAPLLEEQGQCRENALLCCLLIVFTYNQNMILKIVAQNCLSFSYKLAYKVVVC